MKKLLSIFFVLATLSTSAQRLTPTKDEKIQMHLMVSEGKREEGKWFFITGVGITAIGAGVAAFSPNSGSEEAIMLIGSSFSAWGLFRLFGAEHSKTKANKESRLAIL